MNLNLFLISNKKFGGVCMSLENLYSNNVKRKKTELIKLRNDRAKYTKDLSDASQKILRA